MKSEDINADGQSDIVWLDTTCSSSTCFDKVVVYSWSDGAWQNWTDGDATMAYAGVEFDDVGDEGQGDEIILNGGVYGSVSAGPQRGRIETWGSVDGAAYTLLDKTLIPSECLYHKVLDANSAFLHGIEDEFVEAEVLYTEAISDANLIKCWVRELELEELRSFSYFRLALVAAHQGLPEVAESLIVALESEFPESVYAEVGANWWKSYSESNDLNGACEEINAFVDSSLPEAWQLLNDYGYANPSFDADDVCPVIDISAAPADADESEESTAGEDTDDENADEESAESTATEESEETSDDSTDEPVNEEDNDSAEGATDEEGSAEPAEEVLLGTECPDNLDRYVVAFPKVMAAAAGDASALESWMRGCDALSDERGDMMLLDVNSDDIEDAIFLPTIVSDLGYGPGGSQGAVLIYHGRDDGSYELIHRPDIYGQPALLAIDDLNADSQIDLAWTVQSCATSCVTEVQMVSWNGESYSPVIEPGATIAEGTATIGDLADDSPGNGRELLLTGGVSGEDEGGLAVPHTEGWQSVDGAPFQRINWEYDRSSDGSDCVGLRLIEADVALQAADVLGYEDAVAAYTNALDTTLKACSLEGTTASDELIALQGLASFRLIQAQALNGDLEDAAGTLTALQAGQPESEYTIAATQWLTDYTEGGDAAAACDVVQNIFDENEEMWLITAEYGYNHPGLAAELVCFVPN